MQNRIGYGIDVHQLENGTPLIIGGVSISYSKGSKGHSDGDVLFHAIVDAILGSLALGDIGQHFPSDDIQWEDADSTIFLEHASALLAEKGFWIENIDTTLILQNPKLAPYILQMRKNISEILSIELNKISIKATTTDHLGFIGKGEGIAASAVILIAENIGN